VSGLITLREATKKRRILQGEIRKIDAILSQFKELKRTVEEHAQKKIVSQRSQREIAALIIQIVAATWNTTAEAIIGPRGNRDVCDARQVAMVLCREFTDLGIVELGEVFNRGHSVVCTSAIAVHDKLETDPAFKTKMLITRGSVQKSC
jgi:chromosomal replication initiation ATPase DnaA